MPLPLLALAALSAAPQLLKGIQGFSQTQQAKKVKVQETTPAAFKENLAGLRQDAGNQLMPGYGLMRDQMAQGTSNVLAGAQRASGSSADILGALTRADAQRQQGVANLGVQNQQYQMGARRALSAGLMQQAAYQQNDLNNANRERAALRQAGKTNMFSAAEGLANVGTYFGSTAGQNAVNGVQNPLGGGLGGFYDSTPLSRYGARGYA